MSQEEQQKAWIESIAWTVGKQIKVELLDAIDAAVELHALRCETAKKINTMQSKVEGAKWVSHIIVAVITAITTSVVTVLTGLYFAHELGLIK